MIPSRSKRGRKLRSNTLLLPKQEIQQAFGRVNKFLKPTPLIRAHHNRLKPGINLYLKLENFQPTHSFKVRGAFNAIASLSREERARGIICASGGNHGLGVALACSHFKLPCRVFLPIKTPAIKVSAIKSLGAVVILHGEAFDDANKLAIKTAREESCVYIHPFDNQAVMAGQSTIVLELLQQLPEVDSILVSIGGGGLISGIISAVKHYSPKTKVIGVETKGADCLSLSIKANKIVELPAITSIAESLGARKTEARQFDIISHYLDELIVVEDREAIKALLSLLNEEKILVEPASSCTIAALDCGRIKSDLGKQIVAIICGGNVSLERVCKWEHATETS